MKVKRLKFDSPQIPLSTRYYKNNPNLKAIGVAQNLTAEQLDEFVKCEADPIYFITSYVKIVHVDKGIINFDLRDYQRKYIKTVSENRFIISKWGRQTGKSTSSVGYLLHYALFNNSKTIAILANKGATSREILSRLKLAYELLPLWLQQGVKTWNKGSIELENGSSVVAASTSSSAIRGMSISLLFVDEVAFVPPNQWAEFFDSVYPTISSGEETKIIFVSTPKGLNHYYKLWTEAIEKRSAFVTSEINWWDVPGRTEEWKAQTIGNIGQETFDQEFGGEFLGSSNTLINTQTLRRLVHKTPEISHNGLKIYQQPAEGHQYTMTVDCSEGVGGDASAFVIIDVTAKPYNQVAVFKDNKMNPLVFPDFIYQTATKYNQAFVLFEIQSTGKQVADTLVYEFGYENIAWVGQSVKHGQILMGGSSAQQQNGIRTDKRTKRIGCSNIKQIVENNLLTVNDADTILEMSTFIQNKQSFEADEGCNDDIMMCLVTFGWATTQEYFKALNDSDARAAVLAAYKDRLQADLLPQMFSIALQNDEPAVEVDKAGIVWTTVSIR